MTKPAPKDHWDGHWRDYQDSARANPAQGFRRRVVLYHVRRYHLANRAPLRMLDVGCGTGDFAQAFRREFPHADFLGIDNSRAGVEVARQKVPDATFLQADLLQPQDPEERFRAWATFVVCSEVLEHVDEPRAILDNAKPYLAPTAHLIITVPGGPMSQFDRHIGHRRHFRKDTLRTILETSGYQVRGIWGAGFPFFNLYRLTVVARGERLVRDAAESSGLVFMLSQGAMLGFSLLFRFNLYRSSLGWQLVSVAQHVEPPKREATRHLDLPRPVAPGPRTVPTSHT